MLAIDKGNLPIASLLMDARANVNARNDFKQTPLMFAAKIMHAEIAVEVTKKLIENKANIDEVDFNGVSPLMHLASRGNCKTLALLLDAGADTDIQNNEGTSAILEAARNGNFSVLLQLLKAGANYLVLDENGDDILNHAKLSKNAALIKQVKSLPVDIICERSTVPHFIPLEEAAKRLSSPNQVWIHPVGGCEVDSMATLMASHDLWCRANTRIKVPISSHRWNSILDRCSSGNKKTKKFSLGMPDFGVTLLTEISDLVASSATEPKP